MHFLHVSPGPFPDSSGGAWEQGSHNANPTEVRVSFSLVPRSYPSPLTWAGYKTRQVWAILLICSAYARHCFCPDVQHQLPMCALLCVRCIYLAEEVPLPQQLIQHIELGIGQCGIMTSLWVVYFQRFCIIPNKCPFVIRSWAGCHNSVIVLKANTTQIIEICTLGNLFPMVRVAYTFNIGVLENHCRIVRVLW